MSLPLHMATDGRHAVDELGLEQHVRVVEHSVLERNHHKLKTRHTNDAAE